LESRELVSWLFWLYNDFHATHFYIGLFIIDGNPIGFVTWDPRKQPDYVEIGTMLLLRSTKAMVMDICS